MLAAAITRYDISNYVSALFTVYILLLFVYILTNMLLSFGMHPPYSRYTDAVLGFLRDVSEPYLRIFRKFIPPIGMFDLSPLVGVIVLIVLQRVITHLITS